MASYQTLDIAIKIGGNYGVLDDIADDLDTIHRKLKKVEDNTINIDVDGDSESIARSEAVEQSLEDTAGTYTADIQTSGGYDAQNAIGGILTDLGELQGRTVELASQLDFDESYANASLDDVRENLRGQNVESITDADVREFQTNIQDARDRYDRLETELYVDTSSFENKLQRIQQDFGETLLSEREDLTRPQDLVGEQQSVDTEVSTDVSIDPELLFDEINDQLQSATYEVDVEPQSISDLSRNVQTNFTEGDRPSIEDTQQTIRQQFDAIDDSAVADLSQQIHQEFEATQPPSVEDVTRTLRTNVADVSTQEIDNVARTVHTNYTEGPKPSFGETERFIKQNLGDIDDDTVENLTQQIHRSYEDSEPPSIEDLTRHIQTVFDDYDVPHVSDEHRTVYTEFEDTEVPSAFEDIRASVDSGDIENAIESTRRLQNEFSSLDRPALEQRSDTFRQTIERSLETEGDIDTSFIQSQLSNLEDQIYSIDPTVEVDPSVQVDESQIDTGVINDRLEEMSTDLRERRDFYAEMGVDVDEKLQNIDMVQSTLNRSIDNESLDEDRFDGYRRALSSIQQQLHDVANVQSQVSDATSDIEDLGATIAEYRGGQTDLTQSLERESFTNRVDEIDRRLGRAQTSLVRQLDPEAQFDREGSVQTDVELDDNDAYRRIVAMRTALTALDDTVVNPEVHVPDQSRIGQLFNREPSIEDYDLEQRLRSFQTVAEREGRLFGSSDTDEQESVVDFSGFDERLRDTDLGSIDSSLFEDLSSSFQESFEDTDVDFGGFERRDLSTSRLDQFKSQFSNLIGPERVVRARGEQAFSPQDFIDGSFRPEDLIDSDSDFSAQDIFDFDDRELTDVFQSERSFRGYMNPESDVSLSDAIREDRSLEDIAPSRGGRSGRMAELGDINFSTFYTIISRFVPMMLTFVGALPAAIGGLIGLGGAAAAAAASMAAIGGLAVGGLALSLGEGNLQRGLTEIRESLIQDARSAFAPLAQQFSGLGQDALDGVGRFFDRIAAQAQSLTVLKDEARSLGEWVFTQVPQAIDDIVALAQAFAPLFGMLGEWVSGIDFAAIFVRMANNTLPAILMIVDAFLQMLPAIMKFSTGMLHATAVIFRFWNVVWSVIDALGPLAEYIGFAVGMLFSLYTIITLASWAAGAFATVLGASAVQSLVAFMGGIGRAVMSLVGYTVAAGAATTATTVFATALGALLTMTGIGLLLPLIGAIGGQFMGTKGSIDEATKSLKDFKSMRDKLGSGGSGINNPYGPLKHGAMTNIDPNAPTKSGVQGGTQQNVTVNNDNSTEVKVNSSQNPRKIGTEVSHKQFKQKEKSSKPY